MIYLDSAIIEEAKLAVKMGWVKGITTNPTLLKKSPLSPEETLAQLTAISPGELYYQLCATDFASMVAEGKKAKPGLFFNADKGYQDIKFNMDGLASGIYFLSIQFGDEYYNSGFLIPAR